MFKNTVVLKLTDVMKNEKTEAIQHIVKAVHHNIVQFVSLYLNNGVLPGSGRKKAERETESRGNRDSVRARCVVVATGGVGGDVEGVGVRDGRGDI